MTSYAAQVEAMCAGSVDVGFFAPLQMTLSSGKGYGTPVLGALRKDDTGRSPRRTSRRSSSAATAGSPTWTTSRARSSRSSIRSRPPGYVYPTLAIKNKTGQAPKTFFSNTQFAGGHPHAALAVYTGTVDGAAMFIDARDTPRRDESRHQDEDTKVIDTAGPIPNDGVALGKGFPDDVQDPVKAALIDFCKTGAARRCFSALFAWDGMQEVSAAFYDA